MNFDDGDGQSLKYRDVEAVVDAAYDSLPVSTEMETETPLIQASDRTPWYRRVIRQSKRQAKRNESPTTCQPLRHKWKHQLWQFHLDYGACSIGNEVEVYDDSQAAISEMLSAIDSATTRVWMEKYIFDDSSTAETFVSKLRGAAQRGCDVVLIVDWIGAMNMKKIWVEELRRHGVDVVVFNPPFASRMFLSRLLGPSVPGSNRAGPWFFRDHRKILITDDTGYCGSLNVSSDQTGPGIPRFYDIHVRINGPAVYDLANVFRDSLTESGSGVMRQPIVRPPLRPNGESYVQVLESNVVKGKRSAQRVIETVVGQSTSSIKLTTSYFLPPGFLRRALQSSASRGVDISLLLSGKSDIPGDVNASFYVTQKLLKKQREQNPEYQDRFRPFFSIDRHIHAKTLVADGVWASVGSFNWDRYSSRRNLEVTVAIFDPKIAERLGKLHTERTEDPMRSVEFRYSDWKQRSSLFRFICFTAYYFIRLSGKRLVDGLETKAQHHNSWLRSRLERSVGFKVSRKGND